MPYFYYLVSFVLVPIVLYLFELIPLLECAAAEDAVVAAAVDFRPRGAPVVELRIHYWIQT